MKLPYLWRHKQRFEAKYPHYTNNMTYELLWLFMEDLITPDPEEVSRVHEFIKFKKLRNNAHLFVVSSQSDKDVESQK